MEVHGSRLHHLRYCRKHAREHTVLGTGGVGRKVTSLATLVIQQYNPKGTTY